MRCAGLRLWCEWSLAREEVRRRGRVLQAWRWGVVVVPAFVVLLAAWRRRPAWIR